MIRRLAAEALGTGLLIVAVIGSGIMATNLTDDVALQLLCNAVATGGALVALILIFAPVSGASFNPAVGIVGALLGEVSWKQTALYAVAQTVGGCLGAMTANVMFEHPVVDQPAHHDPWTSGPESRLRWIDPQRPAPILQPHRAALWTVGARGLRRGQ